MGKGDRLVRERKPEKIQTARLKWNKGLEEK
jgi:hypothetical protein